MQRILWKRLVGIERERAERRGRQAAPEWAARPSSRACHPGRGPGGGVAAHSSSRPASASAWLAAIRPDQPSGCRLAMKSIADGNDSAGSRDRRCRSSRPPPGTVIPFGGRIRAVRDHQRPDQGLPLGAHPQETGALRPAQPLVAVARDIVGTERRDVEGHHAGCVGSVDSTGMPRSASSATRRRIGKMSAVALVTWLISASRVRRDAAARTASTTSSSEWSGKGTRATTRRAPRRCATNCAGVERGVVLVVGCQQLVTGHQGWLRAERRTVLTPVVALVHEDQVRWVRAEEGGKRLWRATSCAAASSMPRGSARGRAPCAHAGQPGPRRTGIGHAPNDPWLRKARPGSRSQWRAQVGGPLGAVCPMPAPLTCDHRGMCGRMTQQTSPSDVARIFDAELREDEAFEPSFNVAPTDPGHGRAPA